MSSKVVIRFGKYKGKTLAEAPFYYVHWLAGDEESDKNAYRWVNRMYPSLVIAARKELENRANYWDCGENEKKITGNRDATKCGDSC